MRDKINVLEELPNEKWAERADVGAGFPKTFHIARHKTKSTKCTLIAYELLLLGNPEHVQLMSDPVFVGVNWRCEIVLYPS